MAVIKSEDVIAWEDGNKIICTECGDPGEAIPLTREDFQEDDLVVCDQCRERIL
jgi:DNA-directed RNA polymerase subunit RPC12/RpoP